MVLVWIMSSLLVICPYICLDAPEAQAKTISSNASDHCQKSASNQKTQQDSDPMSCCQDESQSVFTKSQKIHLLKKLIV